MIVGVKEEGEYSAVIESDWHKSSRDFVFSSRKLIPNLPRHLEDIASRYDD